MRAWAHFLAKFLTRQRSHVNSCACSRATDNYTSTIPPSCFLPRIDPSAETVNEGES